MSAEPASESPLEEVGNREAGSLQRRLVLVLAGAGLLSAGVGAGLLWLTVSALLSALLVAAHTPEPDRARSVLSAVPLGVAIVAGIVLSLMLTAGLLGINLLGGPAGSAPLLAGISLGLGGVGLLQRGRGGRDRSVVLARWEEAGASIPALGLLLVGAWLSRNEGRGHLGWGLGGIDNAPHVLASAGIEYVGHLSYAGEGVAYPRMFHALAAAVASSEGARASDLATLLRMYTAVSELEWFGWSVVMLAAGLLTQRLTRALGGSPMWAALAGAGAGLTLMGSGFFGLALFKGFATAVLMALLLLTLGIELTAQRLGSAGLVLTTTLLLAEAAHTWQLALVAFAVAVALALAAWLSARPGLGWVLVGVGAAAYVSWIGVSYLFAQLGLKSVALPGALPLYPEALSWASGGVGVVMIVLLIRSDRRARQCAGLSSRAGGGSARTGAALAAGLGGVLLLSALGVAALSSTPLESYYPRKMLWYAAIVGVCLSWAAVAGGASWLCARTSSKPLRTAGVALAVGGLLALLPGVLEPVRAAATGEWTSGKPLLRILHTPGIERVEIVRRAASTSSEPRDQLLDRSVERVAQFWHLRGEGVEVGALQSWRLENEQLCELLEGRERTVVLSQSSLESVLADAGCAPGLRERVELVEVPRP